MIQSRVLKVALVVCTLALLTVWVVKTPPGLLGKADAVGYAVCHRAPARSFILGDRPMPLCARCSGTFLGGFMALIFMTRLGRRGDLPDTKTSLMLGAFLVGFGLDGLNSFARVIPGVAGGLPLGKLAAPAHRHGGRAGDRRHAFASVQPGGLDRF